MYREDEIFDYYFDIIPIGENEKVRSNTPLDSIQAHRFAYLTCDMSKNTTRYLMLLPYLHDRKIYLNRVKNNTDYFYTSLETRPEDEQIYHDKLVEKVARKNKQASVNLKQIIKES